MTSSDQAISAAADRPPPLTLSDSAARRIADILAAEAQGSMLRIAVSGGGCSGFQYGFNLDDKKLENDTLIERDGAVVVIDDISLLYLAGSEIDFVDDIIGAAFRVNNPNATASCSCGSSFSVQ